MQFKLTKSINTYFKYISILITENTLCIGIAGVPQTADIWVEGSVLERWFYQVVLPEVAILDVCIFK